MCCHRALSDAKIEVSQAFCAEDIPVQQVNSRICHREMADDVLIVRLKILRGKALWYLAGQYATLQLPDSPHCRLPIASCPCETGYLEFHLPPSLEQQREVLGSLHKRDKIQIVGPYGSFNIDDAVLPSHHHVFITSDYQFAAIKALIEHIIATEIDPLCTLFFVSTTPYKKNLCRSWADAFDWFNYESVADKQSLPAHLSTLRSNRQPLKFYISASYSTQTEVCEILQKAGTADLIVTDQFAGNTPAPRTS